MLAGQAFRVRCITAVGRAGGRTFGRGVPVLRWRDVIPAPACAGDGTARVSGRRYDIGALVTGFRATLRDPPRSNGLPRDDVREGTRAS